jgi:hypothetical protein
MVSLSWMRERLGAGKPGTHCDVLVAIETKAWVNANGQARSRAGFAKVLVGKETKAHAQQLVNTGVRAGAMVNTDGSWSVRNLTGVDVDYQVVSGDRAACERWLPWVHTFISNAKAWINGTHHGVKATQMGRYVGESIYRVNRRHDVPRLFHRALVACALAPPVKLCALC